MAKDENGLNLVLEANSAEADDEIIDLLEVVKPGKAVSKTPNADEDFSADLESMLDTMSRAEQEKAAEGGISPFPDPTPVSHKVDPHEGLDMPGMDDFDDILNALGAPPPPSSENSPDGKNAPGLPSADVMPDLDALPIAGSAAPPSPATDEELLAELGIDNPFAAPAAQSTPMPETTPVDLEGLPPDIAAPPEAPPASSKAAPSKLEEFQETDAPEITNDDALPPLLKDTPDTLDASGGQRFDDVDLNELDALLDDMLASAPASGPSPAASTPDGNREADTPESPPTHAAPVPAPEMATLRMNLEDLELTLHSLNNRIATLENQQNELYANIDKLAAEAAAKIIREELAALLKAGV